MLIYAGIRRLPGGLASLVIAWCLLLSGGPVLAEHGNWRFQYLTKPDGVWVNEVVSLAQDDDGAIWAATWGEGLQRIHKATWETYSEQTGFVGDWQTVVLKDALGAIWVATADGLCHIQGPVHTTITAGNTPRLFSHEIRSLQNHPNGDLLAGSGDGYIYRCPREALAEAHPQTWEVVASPEQTDGAAIYDLLPTPDGGLWASLKFSGLIRWDGTTWTDPKPRYGDYTYRFGADQTGYWAASTFSSSSMMRLKEGGWVEDQHIPLGVGGFATAGDGTRYLATDEGLYRLEDRTWEKVDLGLEIGSPDIRAILIEEDGTLWLGCREGLIRGTRNSWSARSDKSGYPRLTSVLPRHSPQDPVYALASNHYLVEADRIPPTPRLNLSAAGPGPLKSLTAPRKDRLWAICATGETVALSLEDGRILARIPVPSALTSNPTPYMRLYQGHTGTLFLHSDAGLHQAQENQWVPVPFVEPGRSWDRVLDITEGPDASYFIAGDDGMFQWDGATHVIDLQKKYHIEQSDAAHAVLYRPSGAVWFGTQGSGIYVFHEEEVQHITREQGLRSDMIERLYQTGQDTIWVAYRRQGLGSYRNGHWTNYSYPQGLHNTAIKHLIEEEDGTLWILDAQGQRFDYRPDRDAPDSRLMVAPEQVEPQGRAVFSFRGWDAWDHTPRNRLRYATRVSTVDGQALVPWSSFQETTSWVAPVLPAGHYQFAVRASDEDGNIDLTPAVARFSISPPLWRRPSFAIPLLAATLFCGVLLVSRFRDYRQLQHSQADLTHSNRALLNEVDVRARTEQALRESEARLEEAQALARLGSWSLQLSTGEGVWSQELFHLFQRNPQDGPPSLSEFMDMIHPDDRGAVTHKHEQVIATGIPFEHRFRGNPAGGLNRHFLARVQAHRNAAGDVASISGATQDITAQVQAEEEQEALEEKLRQSQKLEALGLLTGGIAHDFNNILHAMLGFCSLAQTASPDDQKTIEECLDDMEVSIERAAALVRQLLIFSRRGQMERQAVALVPVIEEGLRLVRSTLPATIVIETSYPDDAYTVFADATQIHQIVLNLCTNAAHAMPDGGVLNVSLDHHSLLHSTVMNTGEMPPGNYIRLSIADTGTGIPPEVAVRIFDPFFTTKETGKGSGLGLATVHGIVASMNGGINVETELGKGTTFQVYLASCSDVPDEVAREIEPPQCPNPLRGQVLLVDDETAIVRLAERALARHGISVDAAHHPAEALARLTAAPDAYAILVTDLTMPEMTGLELARKIRAIRPDIPILLLSGHLEDQDIPDGLVTQTLHKPVNLSQLIDAIQQHAISEH